MDRVKDKFAINKEIVQEFPWMGVLTNNCWIERE
jgi:hypothetical protein